MTVEGSDLDATRVALAAASQARSPRVRIELRDVRMLRATHEYDAAAAVDLMHHVPREAHGEVARALSRALKAGGVVLIKDIALTPRWKHSVNGLHDRVVTGSAQTFCREPEDMAAVFEAAGFTVERCERVAPLSPYPHFILRARKAPSSG